MLGQPPPMLDEVAAGDDANRLNVAAPAQRRQNGVDRRSRVVGEDDQLGGGERFDGDQPAEDRLAEPAALR